LNRYGEAFESSCASISFVVLVFAKHTLKKYQKYMKNILVKEKLWRSQNKAGNIIHIFSACKKKILLAKK